MMGAGKANLVTGINRRKPNGIILLHFTNLQKGGFSIKKHDSLQEMMQSRAMKGSTSDLGSSKYMERLKETPQGNGRAWEKPLNFSLLGAPTKQL